MMAWEIDRPAFPAGFKTIGDLWCPRCCSTREFVVPPELRSGSTDDHAANAECCECQYAFGYCNDEMAMGEDGKYKTDRRTVLSQEVISNARDKRLARFRRDMLASGVRLERLNGRAKVHPTNS